MMRHLLVPALATLLALVARPALASALPHDAVPLSALERVDYDGGPGVLLLSDVAKRLELIQLRRARHAAPATSPFPKAWKFFVIDNPPDRFLFADHYLTRDCAAKLHLPEAGAWDTGWVDDGYADVPWVTGDVDQRLRVIVWLVDFEDVTVTELTLISPDGREVVVPHRVRRATLLWEIRVDARHDGGMLPTLARRFRSGHLYVLDALDPATPCWTVPGAACPEPEDP
jgi:hypothetical protein